MNVFVTGGAGYIGSVAAQTLLEAGHRVTVYDSLVSGHRGAVPDQATFIHAELADRKALEAAIAAGGFEAIMHFAAFIEAGESMTDPGKYFHNNLALSIGLIEACAQAGIQHFVFSSSAAVYASSDAPLSEDSPLGPASVYGQTKLMIEQILEWYRRIYGMHYACLRYFNAAGAMPDRGEDHQPESHLIPLVLRVALGQRQAVSIYGSDYPTPDGTCIRDYIHIADLVEAHLLALDSLSDHDRMIYNLGNGEGYSVRQVVEAARQVTGHAIPVNQTARRPGDAPRLVASSERIRNELGWRPNIPDLSQIIGSAWEWHRKNPHGYAD
jgi:UDP-glucose 4-epimerase